jgi:hypothetical protein
MYSPGIAVSGGQRGETPLMKSKWVMAASAIVMAVLGLAGTFLPQEILTWLMAPLSAPQNALLPLVIQLAGALYIAFAMLNWMAKDSVIGGIYNRPLAMGNLVHFMVGGMALLRGAAAKGAPSGLMVIAACYAVLAIAFGRIVFTSPVKSQPA